MPSVSPVPADPALPEIVVVDDTPSHLRLMEALLASERHRVTAIDSPRDALEHLRDHTPALIVLDVDLPGMSGIDITQRLKTVGRLSGVPVLLVTSLRDARVEAEANFVGADALLEKPLRCEALRDAANRYLDRPLEPVERRRRGRHDAPAARRHRGRRTRG